MNYTPLIFVDTWMKPTQLYIVLLLKLGGASVPSRGLYGLKTEARTRPIPEIVWPNPTRPERHS